MSNLVLLLHNFPLQCDKSTALHFACSQGATEVVKVMLSAYHKVCDFINITDGANQTPLHKYFNFTF